MNQHPDTWTAEGVKGGPRRRSTGLTQDVGWYLRFKIAAGAGLPMPGPSGLTKPDRGLLPMAGGHKLTHESASSITSADQPAV